MSRFWLSILGSSFLHGILLLSLLWWGLASTELFSVSQVAGFSKIELIAIADDASVTMELPASFVEMISVPDLVLPLKELNQRTIEVELPHDIELTALSVTGNPATPLLTSHEVIDETSDVAEEVADLSNNLPPPYPEVAIRQRMEGVVILQLSLDANGKVVNARILESSGYRVLDDIAVQTVRKWHGKPAKRSGVTTTSEVVLPIRFRL